MKLSWSITKILKNSARKTPRGLIELILPLLLVNKNVIGARAVTIEEVTRHSSSDDCWSAIGSTVYDLTSYGSNHPNRGGGQDVVWLLCGKDGTRSYDSVHGDKRHYLNEFSSIITIGELIETEEPIEPTPPPTSSASSPTTAQPVETPEPTNPPSTTPPTIVIPITAKPTEITETTSSPVSTVFPTIPRPTTQPVTTPTPTAREPTKAPETQSPLTVEPMTTPPDEILEPTKAPSIETPISSTLEPLLKGVSQTELALHGTVDDCWVAFHGEVYEMTDYAYLHPGPGELMIHPYCGEDGTAAYSSFHSEKTLLQVQEWRVGDYDVDPNALIAASNQNAVSVEELRMHNVPDDCWVRYYDTVFDMTEYAPLHPGPGASAIYPFCGTDGTIGFDAFHSKKLMYKLEAFVVGLADASSGLLPGKGFLHWNVAVLILVLVIV